jgi:hypothetical protein
VRALLVVDRPVSRALIDFADRAAATSARRAASGASEVRMVGRVQNSLSVTASPPSTMESQRTTLNRRAAISEQATVSGDATAHRAHARDLVMRTDLVGAGTTISFTELPKSVQTDVRAYIAHYNAAESLSMSPRTREFLRATTGDDGFDVTFLELDWTGKSRGEVTLHFGVAPTEQASATASGDAVTSLDALSAEARAAVESHIAMLNDGESMSISPKTYTFVSATPQSDGTLSVVLMAKGFMGGGDASTHLLGADGSFT